MCYQQRVINKLSIGKLVVNILGGLVGGLAEKGALAAVFLPSSEIRKNFTCESRKNTLTSPNFLIIKDPEI